MLDLNWYLPNREAEILLGLSLVIAVSALLLRGRAGPKLLWQLIFGFSAAAVCAPIYSLQYGVVPLWTLACFACGAIALVCAYRVLRIDAPASPSRPFQSLDKLIERSNLVRAEHRQGHTVHAAFIAMTCLLYGLMAVVLVYAAVTCGISDAIPGNQFWWTALLAVSGATTALFAPEIFRRWSWNSDGLTTSIGPFSQTILWRDVTRIGRHKLGYWFVEDDNKKRIGWTDYTLRSDVLKSQEEIRRLLMQVQCVEGDEGPDAIERLLAQRRIVLNQQNDQRLDIARHKLNGRRVPRPKFQCRSH